MTDTELREKLGNIFNNMSYGMTADDAANGILGLFKKSQLAILDQVRMEISDKATSFPDDVAHDWIMGLDWVAERIDALKARILEPESPPQAEGE